MSDRQTNPPCILLVDDDADWRTVMREVLASSPESFDVREAADGQAAMDFLKRRGTHRRAPRPELIYLDIEMPGAFGQDVLKWIKSDPDLASIPVVMLTGINDRREEERALHNGADGYLVKPTDPQQLLETVRATIARWVAPPRPDRLPATSSPGEGRHVREIEQRIKNPSILVVEDDPDQRDLILEVLGIHFKSSSGGVISAVGTAAEALREDLARFDIILLDYWLPDMPGLELLDKILLRADLPVIFVTGENVSTTAAEAIRRGAQDYVVKLGDYLFALPIVVEKNIRLYQIKNENEGLQEKLERKNLELQQSLEKLRLMAETDHLTGLSNRRRFAELLERYHSEAVRYNQDLTCCMCDLDHFKALNDSLGHQLGDRVLTLAAEIIRSSIRTSDVAARYGGDEFVMLLPHTTVDRGLSAGERIRGELVLRSRNDSKIHRPVSMSIGVASLGADKPTSGDALVSMADRALYLAKDRGKDRIIVFNEVRGLLERTETPARGA